MSDLLSHQAHGRPMITTCNHYHRLPRRFRPHFQHQTCSDPRTPHHCLKLHLLDFHSIPRQPELLPHFQVTSGLKPAPNATPIWIILHFLHVASLAPLSLDRFTIAYTSDNKRALQPFDSSTETSYVLDIVSKLQVSTLIEREMRLTV